MRTLGGGASDMSIDLKEERLLVSPIDRSLISERRRLTW